MPFSSRLAFVMIVGFEFGQQKSGGVPKMSLLAFLDAMIAAADRNETLMTVLGRERRRDGICVVCVVVLCVGRLYLAMPRRSRVQRRKRTTLGNAFMVK